MDRARSFGIPANMSQELTVKHAGNQLEVETKLIQPGNERTIKDTYVLDGKEYDYAPPAPPNAPPNCPHLKESELPTGCLMAQEFLQLRS